LAFSKRFMIILVLLFLGLLLSGCADPEGNGEAIYEVDEALEDELTAEDEPEEPETDADNEEPDNNSGASFPGSGFTHTVEMDIDGVVEKDQDEQWWVID
jgi:hypothetical protein